MNAWLHRLTVVCVLHLIRCQSTDASTQWTADTQLKLAYGSMLNISCNSSEDCLLKHSVCNPLTKRCECDYGTIEENSRCEVIQCSSSAECLSRFPNTMCMFGRCQCQYGLTSNGQCVKIEVETVKQLPDWAISVIAIGALLSGVLGGRSQMVAQLIHHVMAIVALLTGHMGRFASSRQVDSHNRGSVTELDPHRHSSGVQLDHHQSSRISMSSVVRPQSPVLSSPTSPTSPTTNHLGPENGSNSHSTPVFSTKP